MQSINRKIAPDFKNIEDISFIKPEKLVLDNKIPVFVINAGEQELVRIEFIFNQVNWDYKKPLVPAATQGLLNSGTKRLNAAEIADQIDYFGAFLQSDYSSDNHTITLYTLTKHLTYVLPIVLEVFNEAIFPEHELMVYKQNQKQNLLVNLQKNDFLARRTYAQAVFGNSSYGVAINASDYDSLKREDLISYFKSAFQPANCSIVISGKFSADNFKVLNAIIGVNWNNCEPFNINKFVFEANSQDIFIEKTEALQSAIRIGNLNINRVHPDFPYFQILNTVLGGYFGSRLMSNIREDKGYTYGIGSSLVSLKQAGYFFITTQVGAEVSDNALFEIKKEIDRLNSELILEDELTLVKNYMLGSLLGSLENAFSHADKFKNLYFSGLGYDYYDRYIQSIKECTPEKLLEIANKYLAWSEFTKVVVGKK